MKKTVKKLGILALAGAVLLQTPLGSLMTEQVVAEENEDQLLITGFEPYAAEDLYFTGRPDYSEIEAQLPESISVHLNGQDETTEIPVTWEPGREEYENTPYYFYAFTPALDLETYRLMPTIEELPSIGVFLTTGNEPVSMDETILPPNDSEGLFVPVGKATYRGENIEPILKFLRDKVKMNSAAAIGVLANIYAESAFDPEAVNDGSGAYGICQWLGERKTNLMNFCTNKKLDYKTLSAQLKFLKYELQKDPGNSGNVLPMLLVVENSKNGAKEAARLFCDVFERPGDAKTTEWRKELAQKYWDQFGGTTYTGTERTVVLGGSIKLKSLVKKFTPGKWTSNKTDIAEVDANGKVTAKKAGKCTITAYNNGAAADKMTFKIIVKKVSLSGKKTKYCNEEFSIADCLPDSGQLESMGLTVVKFASSNEKIFAIDQYTGLVTPKSKNGTAKLKVTFKYTGSDGTLYSAGTLSTNYKLKKPYLKATSLKVKEGKKTQLSVSDMNDNVAISFQSADPTVSEIVTNAAGTKYYAKAVGEKNQTTYVYLYLNNDSQPSDKIKVTIS